MIVVETVQLSRVQSEKLHRNYKKSATLANLQYVTVQADGIKRIRKGKGFSYQFHSNLIRSDQTLTRIKKLAIPPAWTDVWICSKENGHIQATGIDAMGRKQYRYHGQWNEVRNQTKFHRLYDFGRALPLLRKRMNTDLNKGPLSREKVLATVVRLMETTFIRVGNNEYEKLYGSYGLTTMKDDHVRITGPNVRFSFKGKKGVYHTITLKNKKLARIVKACRDIPGKELFQYINEEGEGCPIDSGMVNSYIKEATGQDFSAKDFRTWAGTLAVLDAFRGMPSEDRKKNVIQALDQVSIKLGNTRTVCRKYYVHPGVINMYEDNSLSRYLNMSVDTEALEENGLMKDEHLLMKILSRLK